MSKISKSTAVLVMRVLATAEKLGLTVERELSNDSSLPENTQFSFVRIDGGSAAMIIPLDGRSSKWCDLHIDWAGKVGYIPLDRANGAVVCRVDPNKVDLAVLLTALSGASKRDRKVSSKAASQSTDEFVAALKAFGLPTTKPTASEPVTEEVLPDDQEESEGEYSEAS